MDVAAFAGHGELAFVSRGDLYVLDGSSRRLRQVPIPPGDIPDGPSWSSDGRWLAFGTRPAPDAQPASGGVWVLGTGQPAPRRVAAAAEASQWSPTADQLALGGDDTASGATLVLDVVSGHSVAIGCRCAVAWSPDGSTLATATVTRSPNPQGGYTWGSQLGTVAATGGSVTPWYQETGDTLQLVGWWPDGKGVLFWRDPQNSASLAADGLELDGLRVGRTTPTPVATTLTDRSWLSWSPDRSTLALVAGGDRVIWSGKSLALCRPEHGEACTPLPVARGSLALDPAWAPSGSLAFVRAAADFAGSAPSFGPEIVAGWYATRTLWIRPSGGAARPVSSAGSGAAAPTWSKDGRFILFVRNDALWLVDPSSGTATEVAGPLYDGRQPADYLANHYYGHVSWHDQFDWFS